MGEFIKNFNLKDWKVQLWCLGILVVSEAIGTQSITIKLSGSEGGASFSLYAMLFAIIIGAILGGTKKIKREEMEAASPYIGISVLVLIPKLCASIGPNIDNIINAGWALIFQELGNLGTILLSLPVAVLLFKMGRVAVGACFSNSREPSLAIIAEKYGLDSPEGTGVMGCYITGTVVGTVFCSLISGFVAGLNIFHPYAQAMACGTGSASMMVASLAPLLERWPNMADELTAYATTSNILTNCDGLYMSLIIGLPMTNWLYKVMRGDRLYAQKQARIAAKKAAPEAGGN